MDELGKAVAGMAQLQDSLSKIKVSLPNANDFFPQECYTRPIIPEMKNGWQQLIVIGNGFDLECGLNSRYSDFFEPRKALLYPSCEALEAAGKSWPDYVAENGITVWDVILEEYADCLWNDIEKAIALWVVPGPRKDSSFFQRLLSLLNPNKESDIDSGVRKQFSWRRYSGRGDDEVRELPVARFILQTCARKREKWDEAALYDYLRTQLGCLEDEFKLFMQNQLDSNTAYPEKSWKLLSEMIAPFYPADEKTETLTTVLNFNYTNPAMNKPIGLPLKAINVHGKLDGEIVFGIDGKEHMDDENVAPFTKTYRLLGLHSANRFTLFESVGDLVSINKSIDVIKFYGHSLAEPDYSYFQAIFDEVDLYSSNTRLVFYYRNHSGSANAKADTHRNVSRLLSEYGRTMDNVDHGKNLMHKLILEGRLSVLELKKSN